MCETQAVSNPWRYALLSIGSPDPILLTNDVIMKKEEAI